MPTDQESKENEVLAQVKVESPAPVQEPPKPQSFEKSYSYVGEYKIKPWAQAKGLFEPTSYVMLIEDYPDISFIKATMDTVLDKDNKELPKDSPEVKAVKEANLTTYFFNYMNDVLIGKVVNGKFLVFDAQKSFGSFRASRWLFEHGVPFANILYDGQLVSYNRPTDLLENSDYLKGIIVKFSKIDPNGLERPIASLCK